MKTDSFWAATSPVFPGAQGDLPKRVDIAIVGGGFCGLSAALGSAKRGASTLVLEAGDVAREASGRNGGHVNNGLAVDYGTMADRYGTPVASAMYRAFDAAVDTVARLVAEEKIDCDFARNGKLKLATQASHYELLARGMDRLRREVDSDVELLDARQVRDEVDSPRFVGGLVQRRSAQMHMGRFAHGLAEAATRHGAAIHAHTPVLKLERKSGHVHRLHTPRGVVEADQVLVATGTTRHGGYGSFGWWRRRLIPVGSFIVATEPLGADTLARLLPQRRTYTTMANIHHYFRTTPDHRIVIGGRPRFSMFNPTFDPRSSGALEQALHAMFPSLGPVGIEYSWGGLVDMSRDRLPHAGERDGLWYALGFSGHGTQMSTHMGQCMAAVMAGDRSANPWADRGWPSIPGYWGTPWFLPVVGFYYEMKDKLS